MIFKAITFAARAHAGQYRKHTNIPYITHPLAVAEILLACGCSEQVAIAGILHDTVEDTPVTTAEIEKEFGTDVAVLVKGATEPPKHISWEERKQHTLDSLRDAPEEVLLLVCADKLHNLISIRNGFLRHGEEVWRRFTRPKEQQRWYYESMLEVLDNRLRSQAGLELKGRFRAEFEAVFPEDDG